MRSCAITLFEKMIEEQFRCGFVVKGNQIYIHESFDKKKKMKSPFCLCNVSFSHVVSAWLCFKREPNLPASLLKRRMLPLQKLEIRKLYCVLPETKTTWLSLFSPPRGTARVADADVRYKPPNNRCRATCHAAGGPPRPAANPVPYARYCIQLYFSDRRRRRARGVHHSLLSSPVLSIRHAQHPSTPPLLRLRLRLRHGPFNSLLPGRTAPRAGPSRPLPLCPAPPPAPSPARHRPVLRRRHQVSSTVFQLAPTPPMWT